MNINGINKNRAAITEFNGLKIRNNAGNSEFVDMENIDSHEYPYFSTRRLNYYLNKGDYGMSGNTSGVSDDILGCCAYDTDLYYMIKRGENVQIERLRKTGTREVVVNASDLLSKSYYASTQYYKTNNRQMVIMGGFIVVYPDWVKIKVDDDVSNITCFSLSKTFQCDEQYSTATPVKIYMCNENGNEIAQNKSTKEATISYDYSCGTSSTTGYFSNDEAKLWANDAGKYYFQFEGQGNEKKGSVSRYYKSSAMWLLEDEYCAIEFTYQMLGYNSMDALKTALTNMEFEFNKELDVTFRLSGISSQLCEGLNTGEVNLYKIQNVNNTGIRLIFKGINVWNETFSMRGDDETIRSMVYLVIQDDEFAYLDFAHFKLQNDLSLSFDYIVSEGNRLFACSNYWHEIHASKLGDPSMWKEFKGISTDSYAATVGSPGKFTGAAVFNNTPIFFKENCIHRVTGNTPASFNISYDYYDGIKEGCSKSIVRVGNYLIYYSKGGFVYYTGNQPEKIDRQLGDKRFKTVLAGEKEGHYITSVIDQESNKSYLLDYDLDLNQWYKQEENNPRTIKMLNVSNDLYTFHKESCSDNMQHTFIYCIGRNLNEAKTETSEDDFSWYAESGWLIKESINKKYISKLLFKMHLDPLAYIRIYFKYDYNNEWELVKSYSNTDDYPETLSLPLIPQRCESLQYKIEGKGKVLIYSINYDISEGSEF